MKTIFVVAEIEYDETGNYITPVLAFSSRAAAQKWIDGQRPEYCVSRRIHAVELIDEL